MNKEKCIELLNRGVSYKRAGDYSMALDFYEKALVFDPNNKNCYFNPAKVFFGLGEYEKALRLFLAYAHISVLTDRNIHPFEYEEYDEVLSKLLEIDKDDAEFMGFDQNWKIIFSEFTYIKLVIDFNCNKYTGICLTANNETFLRRFSISVDRITDLKNGVLGKYHTGEPWGIKQDLAVIAFGLYFLRNNLNMTNTDVKNLYDYYQRLSL